MPHRRDALKLITAASAATAFAPMFALEAAPLSYKLEPIKIAEGVWYIKGSYEAASLRNGGAIANVAILDSSEGAILIDTGCSKRYGEQLQKLAKQLTGKPVVRALVTHFHPDHAFGNQVFDAKVLAAPQGVVNGLKQSGDDFASAMYFIAGDWMRGTAVSLPETLVKDGSERIGDRNLKYLVLSGHTDTDLAVYDEKSGILFAADLVFFDRAPATPHLDLPSWNKSLDVLSELPFKQLVPGHGPTLSDKQGIRQTKDWLSMLNDTIGKSFERGLSMTEAMVEPLPKWTDKIALARYEYERSVMHIYPKLEAENWPRIDTE